MTPLDILEGIKTRLQTKWPELDMAYYEDYAPQGFQRPSFLVECGPVTQTEAGGSTTEFTAEATITAFLPVDPYHHSDRKALCQRMAEVMALFGGGWFPVGERAPHVDSIRGDYGWDYAEVILSISFSERGYWAEDEEVYPLLESVNINIKVKEE